MVLNTEYCFHELRVKLRISLPFVMAKSGYRENPFRVARMGQPNKLDDAFKYLSALFSPSDTAFTGMT